MFIVGCANPPLLAALLKVNLESTLEPNFDSSLQTFLLFFISTFFLPLYKSYNMTKFGRMLSCSFHSLGHLKST
jgi:hypothetical protein